MIITILKIIGIILLIIFGLLIFIIGLLLFLPIRYRFDGTYENTLNGKVLIKWAPVLLKADITFLNGKPLYVIKLFGGIIKTNTGKKLSWIGRRFFTFDEDESEKTVAEEEKVEQAEPSFHSENIKDGNAKMKHKKTEETADNQTKKLSSSIKKKKSSLFYKIKRKLASVKRKWNNFLKKLRVLKEKREELLKVYHSKRFEMAKKDVILYLKELFQIIKPDKLEGNMQFGFEDPALTGKVLGIAAMLLPFYNKFLTIQPDFTEKHLEGYLKGKGKIYLFSLLALIIKVKFNKNLIKVIKKVQTIIEA